MPVRTGRPALRWLGSRVKSSAGELVPAWRLDPGPAAGRIGTEMVEMLLGAALPRAAGRGHHPAS